LTRELLMILFAESAGLYNILLMIISVQFL
jgi:hypothetical protein